MHCGLHLKGFIKSIFSGLKGDKKEKKKKNNKDWGPESRSVNIIIIHVQISHVKPHTYDE